MFLKGFYVDLGNGAAESLVSADALLPSPTNQKLSLKPRLIAEEYPRFPTSDDGDQFPSRAPGKSIILLQLEHRTGKVAGSSTLG